MASSAPSTSRFKSRPVVGGTMASPTSPYFAKVVWGVLGFFVFVFLRGASEFSFDVFCPFAISLSVYLPRFPDSSDASRVQLLATAVGYPSGAVFGCALHFRTHSFALPPDRHRSPFGSPAPRFFSWRIRICSPSVSFLLAQCAVSSAGAESFSGLFSSRL